MNGIQFILYQLPDEEGKVQVVIKDETIWTTQKAMAQLFDVNIPAISKHLKNIFDEGELSPDATVSKMEIVQMEGEREVKRETTFYSLDAIIAVGYRVSSLRATRFRQWATFRHSRPKRKRKQNMTSSTVHSTSIPTSTRRFAE